MWEGKEEGAKTGNFSKVPKFSHLCCRNREQEDECSQGDRAVKKKPGKVREDRGLSFSGFKSRGSRYVKTRLHINAETRTRLVLLVLWTEDRGRNRGEEGGEEKRETGRGVLALEGGCFPYCCI